MSIFCLRTFNVKFWRQAYISAHTRFVPSPAFDTLRSCTNTNNLFHMVKKRTMEARSKVQNTKTIREASQTKLIFSKSIKKSSSILSTSILTPPLPPQPLNHYPSSSIQQSRSRSPSSNPKSVTASLASSAQKQFSLTQVADTSNGFPTSKAKKCDVTIRHVSDGGKLSWGFGDKKSSTDVNQAYSQSCKQGDSPGGRSDSGDEDPDRNKKLLLALVAALGAGGLLWWLLSRRKNKRKEDGANQAALSGSGTAKTVPLTSAELPKHIPYLLIGGGTAAFSAFRAIKSNDPKAKVLMITNESRKPYMRPPLSKEIWYSAKHGEITPDYKFKQWTGAERSLYFEPDQFFVPPDKILESINGGIAVAHGFTVKKVDPEKRIVTLTDGYEIGYNECLIATGCTPKTLPIFNNAPFSVREKVMVYRTPDDFENLKRLVDKNKSITIIGNGFIGSELACSLANYSKDKDVKIYQVFPEAGNMSKVLPDYLSKWTTQKVEALGVSVLPNASVREVQRSEKTLHLTLNNGQTLLTDIVVVCVGCEANTGMAQASSLEVDSSLGGFVVNAELEARRNLFVAGDVCCFFDPLLGRRRVEHHDHSVVSGRLAGENMVGKKKGYNHQSMFWSDLGPEIGYEGIGLVDACLPTVGVFALPSDKTDRQKDNLTETKTENIEKKSSTDLNDVESNEKKADNYGRGVIFYLKEDKIVGVLLWNLFNRIGLARTVINQNKKFDDINEVAKLFEIHS